MRDFNFKSNSIVIFLYVLENLSSFNQVFFPRCMHFFSQKYAIFLKNMQFFSKICNFSQKYAIFSQKICIGKCLKFSYTYKKNAIFFLHQQNLVEQVKYMQVLYVYIVLANQLLKPSNVIFSVLFREEKNSGRINGSCITFDVPPFPSTASNEAESYFFDDRSNLCVCMFFFAITPRYISKFHHFLILLLIPISSFII